MALQALSSTAAGYATLLALFTATTIKSRSSYTSLILRQEKGTDCIVKAVDPFDYSFLTRTYLKIAACCRSDINIE
jgi:hypothetical protein